jgi:SAM-dependent methyltransferase
MFALAERGHVCHGIDRSPEMIAVALDKVRGASGISFDVQDMRNVQVQGTFDLVSCTFDSLNYLTHTRDVLNMFRSAASALDKGGLLIFDSNTKRMYRNNDRYAHAFEFGEECFIQRMHFNPQNNTAETVFEFNDGQRERHIQRPYSLKQLRPLLKRTGFSIVAILGGFKGERYTKKSERLIVMAEKACCKEARIAASAHTEVRTEEI